MAGCMKRIFEIVECVCIVRRNLNWWRTKKGHRESIFWGSTSCGALASRVRKKDFCGFFRQIIAICRGRGRVLLRRERPAATGLGCGLARIFSSRQWICDDRDSFSLPIPATRKLNLSTNEMAHKMVSRVPQYPLVQILRNRSESRNHFFWQVIIEMILERDCYTIQKFNF